MKWETRVCAFGQLELRAAKSHLSSKHSNLNRLFSTDDQEEFPNFGNRKFSILDMVIARTSVLWQTSQSIIIEEMLSEPNDCSIIMN